METSEMLRALWELQCAGNDENSRYMSAEEKMQDHLHGVYDNAAFSNDSKENKEAGKAAVKTAKELIQRGRELKSRGYAIRIGWQRPADLPPNPQEVIPGAMAWFDCSNGYANGVSEQAVRVYLVNYREMSVQEIADTYGITRYAVHKAIERGKIPARQSGKTWLIATNKAHEMWGNK